MHRFCSPANAPAYVITSRRIWQPEVQRKQNTDDFSSDVDLNAKMSDSLETRTLQDRLDRLQELTEFTENCKKQLHDIFETLGWSMDYNRVS